MRILLIGEYSRLHNSLKEGLSQLGHEVLLVGHGDGFKNYPVDIKLERRFENGLSKKIKLALLKLFNWDISEYFLRKDFWKLSAKLKGFDVVQLINESPFQTTSKLELEIATYLRRNNKTLFLLSCGTDYPSVSFAFAKKIEPSIFTPLFEGKVNQDQMAAALKYLKPEYKELHKALFKMIDGVIATDLDYHLPLKGNPKYLGLIPNPINTDKIKMIPFASSEKIILFHGINRANYYKKGNDLFEAALKIVAKRYSDQVEIITAENLPYYEYITQYDRAHILLDQNYAQDQGYNALEAMAKGKVVFTGAGTNFCGRYNLIPNSVAIDTKPIVDGIVIDLEKLIHNPEQLLEISKRARKFIEGQHDFRLIAKSYLKAWENS